MQGLCQDFQRYRNLLFEVFRREVPCGHANINTSQAEMFVGIEVHLDSGAATFRRLQS